MMKRINKHQQIIADLEQRLLNSPIKYDIFTNLEYGPKGRLIGEIDLYATTDTHALYFEIKSTHSDKSYHTAVKQLNRINTKYATSKKNNKYFYVTVGLIHRITPK